MCLLLVKPKGAKMPDYETIRMAAHANPDGFGFVSTKHSCRTLNFDEFYRNLMNVGRDENCIIHFRWATHGSVKIANCHPFHKDNVWFAHNGILDVRPRKDMTDSETAFRDILYPEIKEHGLESDELRYAVHNIIGGSKFAFLQNNKLKVFGNFTEIDGCLYSNLRFYHLW